MPSYGYSSVYVVAALAGNSWHESHINAGQWQVGGSAYGMFQWDGSRRDNLREWLPENGYALTSPIGQLEFLIYEQDWSGTVNGISSLNEFLLSDSTDIEGLTEAFCECWERPGVPALETRYNYAWSAYDYIVDHYNDENITTWVVREQSTADWLTESEVLNNAVLMYRYLATGEPGTDPSGGGGGSGGGGSGHRSIGIGIRRRKMGRR